MHGSGTMVYDLESQYKGNFENGKREGKGVYYFGDGRYWDG